MLRDAVKDSFKADRLKKLYEMERWHFWFVGRQALIDYFLRELLKGSTQRILDIGCGTGFFIETILERNRQFVGMDIRPEGINAIAQKIPQLCMLQADAHHLPIKSGTFDLVFLLDVLEHVEDRVVLSEVQRVLKQGGHAIITVPAMSWLWSFRDEDAGHRRRYSRRQLTQLVISSLLDIVEIRFYQFFLFPLVVISRLFARFQPRVRDIEERPIPLLNRILTWINKLEVKLSRHISWPWGSSLVVLCEKSVP